MEKLEIKEAFLEKTVSSDTSSSGSRSEDTPKGGREKWTGKLDFILSSVGYCVGIGNIYRFPYLCYKNGGGAFLIPYLVFMVVGAIPIYFLEYSLGQFSSSSSVTVWKICPLFKGVGFGTLIPSGIYCIYINVVMAWVLYFLYQSFAAVLPWSHCRNDYNTDACRAVLVTANSSSINGSQVPLNETLTSTEEYWRYNVLQITKGIEEMGGVRVELLVCLIIAWAIVFICLFKGIKSSGKVVYVTVTFPYLVLIIFMVRAVTLPGALEGIKFFVIPKWERLLSTQVWGEAALQIFFSSGAGWGALMTYSSFNRFNHNIQRDALVVPLINSATSILAGFVTFSILGYMAGLKGVEVDDVVAQGPGLVFVAYPEAISNLPISPLWAVLFFLMLLTISIDTQFGTFETFTAALIDVYPNFLRKRKMKVTAVFCLLGLLLDIPLIMQGGIYVLQIIDWYIALFTPFIVATVECIVVGWIYGTDRFYDNIKMMLGYHPNPIWKYAWKFFVPVLLIVMLIFNMIQLTPVSYKDYQYPGWAIGVGWIFGLASVVPFPVYMIYSILSSSGSLKQRVRTLLKPLPTWGPMTEEKKHLSEA